MNELVTFPSGIGGKNAVSDVGAWAEGTLVEILNGGGGSKQEDRPFVLKKLTVETLSIDSVYELVFYEGASGSEKKIFTERFGATLYPFSLPLNYKHTFPGGTRISVRLMDSTGSGSAFFSVQYEADPGNIRMS